LRKLSQFGLRQFAIGDDGLEMIANLAENIDREKTVSLAPSRRR